MRCKDQYVTNPFRNRKHFPHGGKKNAGYGGEIYAKNEEGRWEERCGVVINKSKERRGWKSEVIDELSS